MSLDGQPASELLGHVLQTWCADLWSTRSWEQGRDEPRIAAAFQAMRLHCMRWPTMNEFARELPKLPPVSAAPIEQRLAWEDGVPANRSVLATAHCRFNAERSGFAVPAWAKDAGDREADVVAMVDQLRETERAERARIRAQLAENRATAGASL